MTTQSLKVRLLGDNDFYRERYIISVPYSRIGRKNTESILTNCLAEKIEDIELSFFVDHPWYTDIVISMTRKQARALLRRVEDWRDKPLVLEAKI